MSSYHALQQTLRKTEAQLRDAKNELTQARAELQEIREAATNASRQLFGMLDRIERDSGASFAGELRDTLVTLLVTIENGSEPQ